jgi:hypothetical protein
MPLQMGLTCMNAVVNNRGALDFRYKNYPKQEKERRLNGSALLCHLYRE